MKAPQNRPIDSVQTKKSGQSPVLRVNGDFPDSAVRIGAPNSVFIGSPREHIAVCQAIVEIDESLTPPVFEHGSVNPDAVVDQGTDDILGRTDGPICRAKYVAAVGRIYRLQERLKKILPELDEFVQAPEAQPGEIVLRPVLNPALAIVGSIEIGRVDVQLHVMSAANRALKLAGDVLVMIIVLSVLVGIFLELKDLRDVGHNGQPRAVRIEKAQQAGRGLDHQFVRASLTIAMDFVIEGEDDPYHALNHALPGPG